MTAGILNKGLTARRYPRRAAGQGAHGLARISGGVAMARRWRGARRAAALALALCLLGLAGGGPAAASPRLCRDLEGQLARIGTGSPTRARQYEKAIADQRRQIDRAEGQLRRAGCSGIFGGNSGSACRSLRSTLERMNVNLANLDRGYRQVSGGGRSGGASAARILASLDANGCRTAAASRRTDGPAGRASPSVLDRLFGGGMRQPRPDDAGSGPADEDRQPRQVIIRDGSRIEIRPRFSGTFRTLCVRTCDGYFFPVAYATPADELDRDAAACRAQCPGTEVELYIHRTPGEETSQMVSLAGLPYTQLPTAFRYRKTGFVRPASCGCGVPKSFSIIAGEHPDAPLGAGAPPPDATLPASAPLESAPLESAIVALPRRRPDPASDPETLANRDGALDRAAIRGIVAAMTADPAATASTVPVGGPPRPRGERRIRVVGPTFLPDPGAAGGQQAPAPNLVR